MAKKHLKYTINGKQVPSVTTILNELSKPGIEKWYGRLGIAEAEKQKAEAAEFGSKVHSAIEAIYQGQTPAMYDERFASTVNNFKKWADHNISEWVAFEKAIYHDELMYAGTIDAVARLKGTNKLVLVDFKTSKKVREEYYLQVVAYAMATRMEDNAVNLKDLEGAIIVHLDHDTLLWEAVNVSLTDDLFNVFKACLEIYKWRNK
jgi:genome maintenance exonuclease 1